MLNVCYISSTEDTQAPYLYVLIFIQLIALDLIVRSITNVGSTWPLYYPFPNFASVIFALFFVGIISAFKHWGKTVAYLVIVVLWFLVALTNIVYYASETVYFSFNVLSFASEGSGYILDSISHAFINYPIQLVLFILFVALSVFISIKLAHIEHHSWILFIVTTSIFIIAAISWSFFISNKSSKVTPDDDVDTQVYVADAFSIFKDFSDKNKSMKIGGLYLYTVNDVINSFFLATEPMSKEDEQFLEEQYKPVASQSNSYTGIFKGKNVIFLQLEGLDYALFNKQQTPVLYQLQQQGINFTQHYTICVGGGSTIGSEFAINNSLNSAISFGDNAYHLAGNAYPFSMPRMFAKYGYTSNVFHFNSKNFYNRDSLYNSWGYQKYYGLIDEQDYSANPTKAELDTELIENKEFSDIIFNTQQPFANSIITYTPHAPFSEIGDRIGQILHKDYSKYSAEIAGSLTQFSVAQFYAKETDNMVGKLIEALREHNLYDNTVIVAYADHYLYPLDSVSEIGKKSGDNGKLVNHSPCFIWSSNLAHRDVDMVTMQQDVLPTVLNMFGVDYDTSKYCGHDIFSSHFPVAYFDDYSCFDGKWTINNDVVKYVDTSTWQNESATYDADKKIYVTPSGKSITLDRVNKIKTYVNNTIKKNDLTLRYNYLSKFEN